MSKNNKNSQALYRLVICAFLVALSIVCGKVLKLDTGTLRFSFENLPILFAGLAFGPVTGVLVGVSADLVGCVAVGYTPIPMVTIGAACIGLLSGLGGILLRRLPLGWQVGLSTGVAHFVGSVAIKTVGLAPVYGQPYPVLFGWRVLNYAIVGVAEAFLVYYLLRHPGIRRYLPQRKGGA